MRLDIITRNVLRNSLYDENEAGKAHGMSDADYARENWMIATATDAQLVDQFRSAFGFTGDLASVVEGGAA